MIRKIEIEEIKELYKNHIKKDFPINEIPPAFTIKSNMKRQISEGFILVENSASLGYSIATITDESVVITLFAIYQNKRGAGIGTKFLKELLEYYKDKKVVILEVEKPEDAKTSDARIICERRIHFYENVGFKIYKDIDCILFGVPYYLMVYGDGNLSKEDIIGHMRKSYELSLRSKFKPFINSVLKLN